jgi:hypothetical protein
LLYFVPVAYRDKEKRVVGVFVRFSCASISPCTMITKDIYGDIYTPRHNDKLR